MKPDFTGHTARLYARYRRDLPVAQARDLADRMGLLQDDVVIDLGCGTGQLAVPLSAYCAGVIGVDPEPQMLAGLSARREEDVMCVLGDDGDLPTLAPLLAGPVGAVVGNALHWMDEPAALRACADVLRPGGAVAVLIQGPPLWLGPASWQRRVRQALSEALGPVSQTCGSDAAALDQRVAVLEGLGLEVDVATWHASHEVDADWVLGHLGSALPPGTFWDEDPGGVANALRAALVEHRVDVMHEAVTTTAVIARRPS